MMGSLSSGEQNLVSLGAALASNSAPCVEHYVGEARKLGYTDRQIVEALRVADSVRRAPAQKVLDSAIGLVSQSNEPDPSSAGAGRTEGDHAGRTRAEEKKPDSAGSASQAARVDRNRCCC